MQTTDKLMEYIQDSPSPYHAAAAAAARLEAAGFTRLEESAPGALSSGQCCYTTRNQSSLIAFRLPGGLSAPAESTCQNLLTGLMLYLTQLHDEYPENIEVMEE